MSWCCILCRAERGEGDGDGSFREWMRSAPGGPWLVAAVDHYY